MKISKQERIAIICFIVAAIIGVGIFVFLMPNYNNIGTNQKRLDKVQKEYDELVVKLEHEATIDDEIKTAYEEGKNLADTFYNDLTTYEADEIMRQFIAKGKDIEIEGLSVSPYSTETLSISVFAETDVTYPLKDFADTVVPDKDSEEIDITSMSKRDLTIYAKKLNAIVLSASEPVTVGCATVSFTAKSDKLENLHEFADIINEGVYDDKILDKDGKPLRKATYLEGAAFQLGETTESTRNSVLGGGKVENSGEAEGGKQTYSMAFTVKMYCIKPVANPFGETSE